MTLIFFIALNLNTQQDREDISISNVSAICESEALGSDHIRSLNSVRDSNSASLSVTDSVATLTDFRIEDLKNGDSKYE